MNDIRRFYDLLFERYGDLEWWPGETTFEIIIGAILTQNTNWKNVEKALEMLNKKGLLSPKKLLNAKPDEIRKAIKSSGYYNQKTLKLARFMVWLDDMVDCEIERLAEYSTEDLRRGLLSIKGIGPETADDILLYALDRPVFVVDTYTFRIAYRHGWIPASFGYDELAELFKSSVEEDVELYKNFHALIVETGKNYCKKSKALCEKCPGLQILPESGPFE